MVGVRFAPSPLGLIHAGKRAQRYSRGSSRGRTSGPELDKLIPLVETASHLKIKDVLSRKERVNAFLERYG